VNLVILFSHAGLQLALGLYGIGSFQIAQVQSFETEAWELSPG
jgi:hypothetical protein